MRAVEAAFLVHRDRADAFGIRDVYRRLAVFVDFENGVVVFLRYEHAATFVRDDAVGAIAGLLPDFTSTCHPRRRRRGSR